MRKIFKFSLPTTVLFLTLFFSANLNGQTTRSVCESGCDYPTIQAAIDAAVGGDTIVVEAGTYEENITIDKALTLIGANQNIDCDSRVAESVIAPTSGAPVVISSDGVSINGFEINAPNHGVAIELSNTSNVSVLYNKVHNIGNDPGFGGPPTNTNTVHSIRYQLDGGSYSNINISNNCISNLSHSGNTFNSASGIGFLQSTSQGTLTNLTIEGNTIENVNANTSEWGDGGRIAYGVLINVGGNANFESNGKVANATIIDNEISNLEGFISTGIGLEGNTENAVVTGNTISNLSGHKVGNRAGGGYDLQALKFENNRYVGTVTVENNSFQTNTFTHSDPDGVGYAVANYVPADPHGTAEVSCNWFGTADVFEIMDNDEMDGRVFSKDGSGIEFLPFLVTNDIDNPDCSGEGPVVNTTQSKGYFSIQAAVDDADAGDTIEVAAGTYDEVVLIDKSLSLYGPNANISAVDGSRLPEARLLQRININEDENVTISGFEFFEVPATSTWTIYIYGNSNNFTFENNRFINIERGAIRSGDGSQTGNIIVRGNLVDGISTSDRGISFGGIYGNSAIENNKLDLSYSGIPTGVIGILTPSATDLIISGNIIENVTTQGLQLSGACGDVIIENNFINNTNTNEGIDRGAIRLYGTDFTGPVTIRNNILTNSYNGLAVRNGENISGKDILVENNDLSGNSNNSIYNGASSGSLSAPCNWFGTVEGAVVIASITGDANVNPFLTSGDNSGSAEPGFSPTGNCDGCLNGEVTNITQATVFCSIQEAIDAADPGDVIEVGPGTYVEALEILTNNLTLVSTDGSAETIIDADGAVNAIQIGEYDKDGIHPTGVTIDGFTIEGWAERGIGQRNGNGTINILNNTVVAPTSGSLIRGAIILSGGDGSQIIGNTVTIPEFGSEGWSSAAIMLLGTVNALVEDNDVTGHPDVGDIGIGIFGYPDWSGIDPHWVSATGNTIKNNSVSNCGSGISLAGNAFDNTIEDNTITENERGVDEYPQLGGTPSGNVVTNNTIEGNELGIRIAPSLEDNMDYDPPLSILNNTFSNNFPFQVRDFSAQLDVEDVVVNSTFDRGVYLEGGSAHVGSVIQSFLNNDNVTVNVLPGIYEEVLEIVERDDISIVGTDKATTIVRASNNDLLNWPAYHPSSSRKTAVLVDRSEEIHISGFTFDFDNVGTGQGHTGLMMWNSTGSFQDNAFINRGKVGYETDFNAYVGADETTIYDDNNRAEVLFKGNEFENTGRVGLNVQNFVFLTVEDNSFTKTFDDPGYAIEMSSLSNGLIKDNTISNFNTSFSDNSSSSGIYIHNNFTQGFINPFIKQVDVEGNTIDNCTHGIYIGSTSGGTQWNIIGNVSIESSVSGNTITNSETSAIFVTDDGASLGSEITADFKNNSIDGGDNGYHLNTYWGDGVLNISISNGKIENVGTGILVIDFNDFYNDPSDSEYDISITETSISNFSDFAIRNQYDQITLSATCNWYGTINSAEIAASISGDVTFFPWLTSGVDTEPGQPGFVPETGACDDPIFIQLDTKDDLSCLGGDDGAISVTVSGGQTPYSYEWSGPAGFSSTDQNISGLEEGVYQLTVTDDNDATGIFSSEILPPSQGVNLDPVNDIGPICAGDQLEVSFNASGHGDTYTYAWTNDNTEVGAASGTGNIDFQVANATSEVQTATFSVIATNNLGCESDPITFEVTVGCGTISGTITELDGTPMEGVSVNLTGDDEQTTATNSSGVYSFDQTAGSSFVIAPDLDQLFQNPADLSNFGVASNDATAILNHLNGSQILNGIPLISADTRTTNNVTGADRAVIVVGLLGNPVAINFWNFKSWYFIETDHDFNNPAIPWDYASTITVEGQNGIVGDIDFHGFRKGDITGTIAAVDDFHNPVSRSADIVNMLMKEKELQSGQSFEVDVRFSDFESITSMQFALEFDPNAIEFLEVKIGEVLSEFDEQNVGLFGLDQGILRFVWATSSDNAQTLGNDDVVFTLVFDNHSQDGGKLSEFLGISDNDISALAFTSHMEMPIEALFEEALSTEDMFGDINHFSAKAQPNPFSGRTDIQFKMPVAGEVQFDIYTADGKQVSNFVRNFQAGTAEVAIDDQIIEYPGLYLIKLRSETGTSILRLVRTEQ